MNAAKPEEIIIIKKKVVGHGGHHGGAWKVAYADFVTAMMSLFIVLWLTSSNDAVKKSVAQYFNDPKGTAKLLGTNRNGSGNSIPLSPGDVSKLKDQIQDAERKLPDFEKLKGQIEITAYQDGLRIELLEQAGGTFFQSGSPDPTQSLQEFLRLIAPELGKMQTRISIEGHTDSIPFAGGGTYTNWELSTDRANAARRLIEASGVSAAQIAEVRGFADQLPRKPEAPDDPSNRRITLIVQPLAGAGPAEPSSAAEDDSSPASAATKGTKASTEQVAATVESEKKGE
jgi:chemotaxis protein MotB